MRDFWTDCGCGDFEVVALNKWFVSKKLFCTEKSNSILKEKSCLSTSPYGKLRLGDEPVVLFTTYSSLVAKKHGAGRGKNSSRLGQIVNWLGADFDGPLGNSFFCTEIDGKKCSSCRRFDHL